MAKTAPQTRSIGGVDFTCTPMPAMRSLEVLRRLGEALGPAFAELGKAVKGARPGASLLEADIDLGAVGAAFAQIFVSLREAQLVSVTRDGLLLGTTAMVDGRRVELMTPAGFDLVFTGDLGLLFRVLAFSAEVQYGDFSAALRPFLAASSPVQSRSESPTT